MPAPTPIQTPVQSHEKIKAIELPVIDLLGKRSEVSKLIVKACDEFGFFKVINHGVPEYIITRMEEEALNFFAKSLSEKQRAGPPNPFGYGSKNIGCNGDMGEVEYLLFNANSPSTSQIIKTQNFSCVSGYIKAVKKLACEILDLMAEGLWVPDTSVFSRLITDVDSDSLLRLNHYPNLHCMERDTLSPPLHRIGFGEHSDPQILTLLRSNDVGGLQISMEDGVWVPVSPDPKAFCVNVGDVLQAMTNGRFVSVRHRALTNSSKSRMSMAFFGAPPLHALITCPSEMITPQRPSLYRSFTWAEYKEATYALRLGDSRLNLFRTREGKEIA